MVELYKGGTGWIGLSPAETLDTPLPLLDLAIRGKVQSMEAFAAHIGLAPPNKAKPDEAPDPDIVAERLKQTFRAMAAKGKGGDGG